MLVTPINMTHNSFGDLVRDLLVPIKDFIISHEIKPSSVKGKIKEVDARYYR